MSDNRPEPMISEERASEIQARNDLYEAWVNGRTCLTQEDLKSAPCEITNEERGQLEKFLIYRDKPLRLFAYCKIDDTDKIASYPGRTVVTVWTGLVLGHGRAGPVWRSNFGDHRRSLCVVIAGETYSGTAYIDAGDYCRLRRCKRPS